MGFKPTRAEHNGLAVHRLNHSATPSHARGHLSKVIAQVLNVIGTLNDLAEMLLSTSGHHIVEKQVPQC